MILLQSRSANDIVSQYLAGLGVPYAGPLGAALTFVIAAIVVYLIARTLTLPLIDRGLNRRGVEEQARRPIRRVVRVLIGFLAIGVAFGVAGYGSFLTSLATVAAAATLAIGFALQDTIKNFVAGIFIYTDRPFRVGDWVEWDSYAGIVEDISFRVSRVRTFDNELLTVPNSTLTDGVIKNPVAKDELRIKCLFGIHYDDDIEQATDIILEAAEEHEEILADPEPSVRVTELADSYVGLQSRIWVAQPRRSDFIRTRSEYVSEVKQRFDAADITIPFPQRTLGGSLDVAGEPEPATASEVQP